MGAPGAGFPDTRRSARSQRKRAEEPRDGSLVGDGTRLIAYQSAPRQVAWTSFDGRTWRRLTLTGTLPSASRDDSYGWQYEVLLPLGLLFRRWDESGSVCFGVPRM